MLSIHQVLLDLATPALAVGTGIFCFKQLNRFNKLLFFQTLIYIVLDFAVARTDHNGWMYNMIILAEMGLILLAVGSLFNSVKMRYTLLAVFLIFIVLLLADLLQRGFIVFARDAAIAENFLLVSILLYVVFAEFMGRKRKSIIVACTGMVIYFACFIPYLGIIFYLQNVDAGLNQKLFQYLVVGPQALRYFLVAFAFALQVYEERKEKEIKPI